MNIASIIKTLNEAVAADWITMHNLVERRYPTTLAMMEHRSIVVQPIDVGGQAVPHLGLLGLLNGIVRNDNNEMPIEAMFDEDTQELTGFRLRGVDLPVSDQRRVAVRDMIYDSAYRVRDQTGTHWEGIFARKPKGAEHAVYLRLTNGRTGIIFYQDVDYVIPIRLAT